MPLTSDFFPGLERALSKVRWEAYLQQDKDPRIGLQKYLWNTALCESLYTVFQILEVSFRNATHAAIAIHAGPDWLGTGGQFLRGELEKEKISAAIESLKGRGKPATEGLLVAELSFGFWTSLLDVRYDIMWHRIIRAVVPNMPREIRTRSEISSRMNAVRKLRNAAMHHHSIWHWHDLAQQHEQARQLVSWICASSSKMLAATDRFPDVMKRGFSGFSETASALSALV